MDSLGALRILAERRDEAPYQGRRATPAVGRRRQKASGRAARKDRMRHSITLVSVALLGLTASASAARPFVEAQGVYSPGAQPLSARVVLGVDDAVGPLGVSVGVDALGLARGRVALDGALTYRAPLAENTTARVGLGFAFDRHEGKSVYGPTAMLGAEYALSTNLALSVEGTARYALNTDDRFKYRVGAGLKFSF